MQRGFQAIPFAIEDNGTTYEELPPYDFSHADILRGKVVCTVTNADAGDTLDIYVESRGLDGIWEERIHFGQLTGDMSASAATPETRRATLSKMGTLSDNEEAAEGNDSLGASSINASTVLNGPFPGRYRNKGVGTETGWRIKYVAAGDADNDLDFQGEVFIEWDSMTP